MDVPPKTILLIGYVFTLVLILAGFMKRLRNDKVVGLVIVVSLLIAILGFMIRGEGTKMINGNAANSFFGPLIYISSYGFLRHFYKKKHKAEPTYERSTWFDYDEKRRQNWFDVTVHLIPMMLSIVVPLLIP